MTLEVPSKCQRRSRGREGHMPLNDGTCLFCGLYLPDVRLNTEAQK